MKQALISMITLLVLVVGPAVAETSDSAPSASPPATTATPTPANDVGLCNAPFGVTGFDFSKSSEPQPLSCSAQTTCFGGDVVSCTGTQQCVSMCNGAYCDGQLTECTCDAPPICSGWETAYCGCRSCGGTAAYCRCCWCLNGGVNCSACGNPF